MLKGDYVLAEKKKKTHFPLGQLITVQSDKNLHVVGEQ